MEVVFHYEQNHQMQLKQIKSLNIMVKQLMS